MAFDDFDFEMSQKADKPFYIPRKNELLKYKDEFYFEKNKEYKELFRYVLKHITKGDRSAAKELCEDIQLACQTDNLSDFPSSIIFEFNRRDIVFDSEDQLRDVMDLVTSLANNTRIWSNNGHTPNELTKLQEQPHLTVVTNKSRKKVGRNDPCPCGSGKKYKKCCL